MQIFPFLEAVQILPSTLALAPPDKKRDCRREVLFTPVRSQEHLQEGRESAEKLESIKQVHRTQRPLVDEGHMPTLGRCYCSGLLPSPICTPHNSSGESRVCLCSVL